MSNFQYLQNLIVWYRAYWYWSGPANIRDWELRKARRDIMLAATVVRVDRLRGLRESTWK